MDAGLNTFKHFVHNMSVEVYILVCVLIILILLLIHLYSLRREKKKLNKTISTHVDILKKAFNSASDWMMILTENNEVVYANTSIRTFFEFGDDTKYNTLVKMPKIKIGKEWIALDVFLDKQKNRLGDNTLPFPQSMLKTNQKELLVNLYLKGTLKEKGSSKKYLILTIQDMSNSQQALAMSYKHKLTGLPNEIKALRDIPALFSKIHTENNHIALALMSFDNFSMLRSIIGHEQSNEVIIKFSKTILRIITDMNVNVYHTFDNNFLLTMSSVDSIEDVKVLIRGLQNKLATAYKIEDSNLHITVSVGIAVYPESGSTRTLLDNAYKALAQAQSEGDSNIIVYIPNKVQRGFDELKLHNDMKKGLENGEFEVYYQPIVNANTEELIASEALIRWIHPELGFIPPDVFIGLMEKTGFIIKLGKYVLEEVLKQQKRWELFKFKPIEVSINVSMVEIATGKFVEHVASQLTYHQVYPERIKFEITEGVAMLGEEESEKYFHQLKKLGVGISLDDFGTGYTSFTYLKKFPADILKIDKSLVDNILTSDEDKRIVYAIIDLGHNLGMKIVVEGVETKEMLHVLQLGGADYIQGYYFSRPLPVFEFQKLLR